MIRVSSQNLWFGLDAQTDTLDITSNCDWTVIRNDTASWYTITPLEGTKNGSLLVTVTTTEARHLSSPRPEDTSDAPFSFRKTNSISTA